MGFLNDFQHFGSSVAHTISSPFRDAGKGVSKVANTLHNDAKGISKGVFSITKGITSDIGKGITQLTSPIGLISIAVVVGAVALISMTRSK